jgi:hypothetical protein
LYGELLESVYANVGLAIEARTQPAPSEGEALTIEIDDPRALGFLQLRRWEGDAGSALKEAVHHLLAQHVDVAYADIDLVAVADVNRAAAELNELGFFAAGLVLHGRDGHDYLRLQLLDSEEIELETVVCDSPFAEGLRQRVLEDKARVDG